MANCDIYISSANASGEETYELARSTSTTNTFEPLTLTITPFEGQSNFSAYNIQWMYEGDLLVSVPKAPVIQVDKPGDYRAILTLKMNPSTVCEAEVHIKATPCYIPPTPDSCGTNISIQLPNGLAEGVSIAPGDQFTVGDFLLTVTSITSGSKAGWKGKGYVTMRLPMNVEIGRFSVLFTDAVINDCYELASGKVESEYDPNWGGVLDVDASYEEIKDLLSELKEIYTKVYDNIEVLDCTAESKSKVNNSIESLNDVNTNFATIFDVSASIAAPYQTKLTEISTSLTCKVQQTCPSAGGRVSSALSDCDFDENKTKFEELFCEISFTKKIVDAGGNVSPPNCTGSLYYFTPSGKLVALPCDAKPRFGTTTSLPVHKSALIGFEIITGNAEFGPPGHYDASYLGQEFRGFIKRDEFPFKYYYFPNTTPSSLFTSSNTLSISIGLPVAQTGVSLGIVQEGLTFNQIVQELGLVLESNPQNYFRAINLASGVGVFVCAMLSPANYASFTTGAGEITQYLPELLFDPQSSNKTIIKPALDTSTFPKFAPVEYPDECEPFLQPGTCGVYVITGPNFGDAFPLRQGQFDIAKYGMTCNLNGARPQLQVNSFNLTHAVEITAYNTINFDWRWVKTNISKPECHLLEKDLTANYIIENGGRLPWKHGLPKFKEAEIDNQTGFETGESLLERRNRAIKYLQDRINSCK